MTKTRADEILRKVIYARINHLPTMKDSEDAFHVGRMVGQMQRQLEIELSQEVDADRDRLQKALDEILAEIEEASTYDGTYIDRAYVLEIIDKHRKVEE